MLLWIALFVTCATSVFLHPARVGARADVSGETLFDDAATTSSLTESESSSFSSSSASSSTSSFASFRNQLSGEIMNYFNIEGAGAYSILGFNAAKITYPTFPGHGVISSAAFAIDPAQKKLMFNQGWSGNQYVFDNGTYITLNTTKAPGTPLICTYLPYVNYTQEVLAINNITLQDYFYQPAPRGNGFFGNNYEQVKLYSGIMVDASSCGTMIQFGVASTQNGHIRGIYAAEPFHIPAYGSPTGAAVASSSLVFDDSTIVQGTPHPSFFQLPSICLKPNLPNYCAATGYGAPPTAVRDLYPPIQ
jgi:hypothetical protein